MEYHRWGGCKESMMVSLIATIAPAWPGIFQHSTRPVLAVHFNHRPVTPPPEAVPSQKLGPPVLQSYTHADRKQKLLLSTLSLCSMFKLTSCSFCCFGCLASVGFLEARNMGLLICSLSFATPTAMSCVRVIECVKIWRPFAIQVGRTLLGAPGRTTRNKKLRTGLLALLLGAIGRYERSKKLLVTRASHTRSIESYKLLCTESGPTAKHDDTITGQFQIRFWTTQHGSNSFDTRIRNS